MERGNDICSHQTRSLGSLEIHQNAFAASPGHRRVYGVFRAQITCLHGCCKYRPISVKRNVKIEANVIVAECTVCYRLVVY